MEHYYLLYLGTTYFIVDHVFETIQGTSDFMTNVHHVLVIFGGINHMLDFYSGHEYIIMHLVAEISNPFLILRTMLKIADKTENLLYEVC